MPHVEIGLASLRRIRFGWPKTRQQCGHSVSHTEPDWLIVLVCAAKDFAKHRDRLQHATNSVNVLFAELSRYHCRNARE